MKTYWHFMQEDLSARYGATIGTWLAKRVGRDLRKLDLDCSDNFRTCEGITRSEVYKGRAAQGCCSFFDKQYTFETGPLERDRYFWVGLNYGH